MSWKEYWVIYNKNPLSQIVDLYKIKFGYGKIFKVMNELINFELNRILEAGCGKAEISKLFSSKTSSEIFLIDNETYVFRNLQNENRFKKIVADMNYLPFKKIRFDLIYNCGVLEHFEKPSVILEKLIEYTDNIIFAVPCYSKLWKAIWYFRLTPEMLREQENFLIRYEELKERYQGRGYILADIRKITFLMLFPYWVVHIKKCPI